MKPRIIRPLFCLALLVVLAPCAPAREKLPPEDLAIVEQRWPDAKKTYTGLRYIILEPGDAKGPSPVPGEMVAMAYKGMLLNGKIFDQSTPDKPLKTRIARDGLIEGWEEAIQKMHRGEKWLLIVPSELAYGSHGNPPLIKRDTTLVFEMQLLDFGENVTK
ncbi:MAG: FKBP-type peptidyl-prolyl cis-trans isomerase [Lacunisphaera sp.]